MALLLVSINNWDNPNSKKHLLKLSKAKVSGYNPIIHYNDKVVYNCYSVKFIHTIKSTVKELINLIPYRSEINNH